MVAVVWCCGIRIGANKKPSRREEFMKATRALLVAMFAAISASPIHAQTKIAVGYTAAIDTAPLFIATEKGFFQKRGLEVVPQLMSVNSIIPPALVSDSIQIGMPTASTFLLSVDGGLDLVAISGLNATHKNDINFAIVTRAGADIKKPQDFIGKKVGVPGLNAFLHVMFREWLHANGVDPKQVNYVETAFPQMNEILKSGSVDAVVSTEPFQSRIIKAGTGTVLSYFTRELPEGLPIVFFATTRKWADANPAAVKAFHDGMAEAITYLPANLDESRQITAKYLKLPLEIVASVTIPPLVPDIQADALARWVSIMKSQDMLRGTIDPNKLIVH
jgi:NitT/TauT family transport system substrate-binding protein